MTLTEIYFAINYLVVFVPSIVIANLYYKRRYMKELKRLEDNIGQTLWKS